MSGKFLRRPILVAVAAVLMLGLWLQPESPLWGAEPADDPFAAGPSEKPAAKAAAEDPFGEGPSAGADPFAGPTAGKPQAEPSGNDDPFATGPAASAQRSKSPAPPAHRRSPTSTVERRFGEEAILKALEEPASIEYRDTPLRDVIGELSEKHRIQIVFDQKALDNVGIAADVPITVSLRGIPFRSALDLMLGQLDLTWTIHCDVLLISTREEADQLLVTKTYDVSDLLATVPDRAYRGDRLPTTEPQENWPYAYLVPGIGGGAPSGGTSAGWMGGSYLGGSMSPTSEDSAGQIYDLIDAISRAIGPTTWDEVGGPGTCTRYGPVLVVTQTYRMHLEVEAFLKALRAKRQGVPTVAIDARWLLVDSDALDRLAGGKPGGAEGARITVDLKTLDELTRTLPGCRARIVCLSGQKVYLAAGDRRSVVHGAIPVIGSGVGYQPIVQIPNVGVVLELRPTIEPGTDTAVLDVQSTVTEWREPDRALHIGSNYPASREKDPTTGVETDVPAGESSIDVDRVNMPTQQFAATARVPLGKPVLLGGLTLAPTSPPDEQGAGQDVRQERKQLYLVIETSRVADSP